MSKKIPQTSLDAYRSLDPIKISEMHRKIERAVHALGSANYEGIALYLGVAESKVWKRLSEAVKAGLIYKTGETVLTKSNCQSYVYAATCDKDKPVKIVKKEKFPKGKTAHEHASSILKQSALNF